MTRSAFIDHSQSADPKFLHTVEKRAEHAEHRVEELEHRLEALENTRSPESPRTNDRPPVSRTDPTAMSSDSEALDALRNEPVMDHLLNALDSGKDIGHYGRLVFAMVAHHFLSEDEMLAWLAKDPGINREEIVALLRQVEGRDYNPPRRDRILAWQAQQEFPILPDPEDPDCGNVYRNLKFPQSVYDHIQHYQEEKIEARDHVPEAADSR